jgi:hypothetical protein
MSLAKSRHETVVMSRVSTLIALANFALAESSQSV